MSRSHWRVVMADLTAATFEAMGLIHDGGARRGRRALEVSDPVVLSP